MRVEQTILKNLIYNDEYTRKVLPFIRPEYFTESSDRKVFNAIHEFVQSYNVPPSIEAIALAIKEARNLTDVEVDRCEETLKEIRETATDKSELQWLVDRTEQFCQEKAIYNAVLGSISILEGKDKTREKGSIPTLLSEALAISFDNSVGHDYLENTDERYDFYHRKEERLPFDLEFFNKITKGGLPAKTLNIALAGTGVGKSLFMCHVSAGALVQGKNVLYITMEMAEEKIAERIDANLLNVTVDDLMSMPKEMFDRKVSRLREKTVGKLIIKEYPTASASATHFRSLLNELQLKKSFVPDLICIDYLNICCSSRLKAGANVNSYTYVKAIAEELRGLAVEFGVPIISATQTTRSGFTSSDPGLEDTSESFGLPATADLMFALISSEELEAMGQLMVKQLKNRYNDPNYYKRFTVGIDRSKMRLFDIEQSAQEGLADAGHNDKPLNTFGDREKPMKKNFDGFKV